MRIISSFPANNRITFLLGGLAIFCVATNWLMADWLHQLAISIADSLQSDAVIAVLVFLGLSTDILLPVPSSFLSIWSVVSLGFSMGFVTIWAGLTCSCIAGYILGAMSRGCLPQDFFERSDLVKAQQLMNRFGMASIVLLRAIPVLAEVSVFAAGIARMQFVKFFVVSTLANAGIALIYASASGFLQQQESLGLVFAASVAVPLLAYVVYFSVKHTKSGAERGIGEVSCDSNTLLPSFNLRFEYPLHFSNDAFAIHNSTFAKVFANSSQAPRVLFFIDNGVAEGQPQLENKIRKYCAHHNIHCTNAFHVFPGGDQVKSIGHVEHMLEYMMAAQLDRQSYVCAIGGGALLDAVGYAAATFHRGVRLIRMPTTLLAQNDAGVGVKNGINDKGIKNLLGTFATPYAIINDSQFLRSLTARDFRAGFAEAIKVALIRDGEFYTWISQHREKLARRDQQATEYLIFRCAQLHLNQICFGGDPFEKGSARPLDYGHWSAHKLESITQHELNHGEAVASGMALDALYAVEQKLLTQAQADDLLDLLQDLGFTLYHPAMHQQNAAGDNLLMQGLEEFRQHLGGNLSITILSGLGTAVEVHHIDQEAMLYAFDTLKARA